MEQSLILEDLKKRIITQKTAATRLNWTTRWVRKRAKLYNAQGIDALIHKNRGKPSKSKIPFEYTKRLIELFQDKLSDAGPTYLSQKMEELYGIKISRESVRTMLYKEGHWYPKKSRRQQRIRRQRVACVGTMVQLDGSHHDWFEGRAPRCTLLVFIDDATSKILWLEFAESESTEGLMTAAMHYFQLSGLPNAFYVDYGSVFSVNTNNHDREKITQFQRAMQELNIRIIHASSPQAKGRVERANRTLQDRLVKEMRLKNICSMQEANRFIQTEYITLHNKQFAHKPASLEDRHRSAKSIDLPAILCLKSERILQNDSVISYKKRLFQLHKQQPTILRPKDCIMIHHHLDGKIVLFIRKIILDFTEITSRPAKPQTTIMLVDLVRQKPGLNSRRWVLGLAPIYPSESRVKTALPAAEAIRQKRN